MKLTTKNSLSTKFLKQLVKLLYKQRRVEYEVAPEEGEASIFACNHSGALGPATMQVWFDRPFRTWAISYLFDKEVATNYVFHDIFFGRSKRCKGFFRFLSRIVAKLLPKVVLKGDPILVFRNSSKIRKTFNQSIETLSAGKNIVVFPESPKKFSEFVSTLYDGFVDIARFYYQKTKSILKFYPIYIPADLKTINVGVPVEYNPQAEAAAERKRIAEYLTINIDKIARGLPTKKTIPFMQEVFYKFYPEFVDNPSEYWNFCNKAHSD